jgi:hypothetical protein
MKLIPDRPSTYYLQAMPTIEWRKRSTSYVLLEKKKGFYVNTLEKFEVYIIFRITRLEFK